MTKIGTVILISAIIAAVSIAFAVVVTQMVRQSNPLEVTGFYADGDNFVQPTSTANGSSVATLKEGQKAINMQLVYVDEANQFTQINVNKINSVGQSNIESYTIKPGEVAGTCDQGVKLMKIDSSDTATFRIGKQPDGC